MFDIVIANGTVIDGSGAPGTRMDVGVSGDKIAAVGEPGLSGLRIIDAEGMVICPGFIDAHSHTDHTVFINPTCESKVTQGVTTEISGNCGGSAYPCQDPSEVSEFADAFAQAGVDGAWKSMGEFLSALDKLPMTINFATHIGQGSVRTAVIGYDDRPPSASELSKMVCMVEEALASGALGLSSGLIYPPSCYATTEELIELCRPLSRAGGIYASHIRDEGEDLLSAVEEAIRIGREAGFSAGCIYNIDTLACIRRAVYYLPHLKGNLGAVRRPYGVLRAHSVPFAFKKGFLGHRLVVSYLQPVCLLHANVRYCNTQAAGRPCGIKGVGDSYWDGAEQTWVYYRLAVGFCHKG
jgi:N-acyl-D-aspartate/D-glutamate deacylase